LAPLTEHEVEDRKGGGMAAEAALLARASRGRGACVLDERGATLTSPEFAHRLARWRDAGGRMRPS
jgi:23S rRNA (pseudouridine1915-N3)-methyltransferase